MREVTAGKFPHIKSSFAINENDYKPYLRSALKRVLLHLISGYKYKSEHVVEVFSIEQAVAAEQVINIFSCKSNLILLNIIIETEKCFLNFRKDFI